MNLSFLNFSVTLCVAMMFDTLDSNGEMVVKKHIEWNLHNFLIDIVEVVEYYNKCIMFQILEFFCVVENCILFIQFVLCNKYCFFCTLLLASFASFMLILSVPSISRLMLRPCIYDGSDLRPQFRACFSRF